MPKKEEHVSWAVHNRDFWMTFDLDTTPFTDWVINGIFYEGMHWVEAFLALNGYHSGNHGERLRNMHSFKTDLSSIQADYSVLKQDSETGRYRCYQHSAGEVRQLIPMVDNIKNHISGII